MDWYIQVLDFLTQHGGAKVGNFSTLAINHKAVIAFFLFTDKRISTDKILFSILQVHSNETWRQL